MRAYTLVGKSGTGKSFHAMNLAKKLDIKAIIDDGLFIYDNIVIAGISAKKATTKIGAVKTALFYKEEHRISVIKAIETKNPKTILILGTSDEMIEKIIERLELKLDGEPIKIRIEDITTEEERATAQIERQRYGKHVIPAPTMQLKKNFAGYFMTPLNLFRGNAHTERTVVRPPFSYKGEYIIGEEVITDIIFLAAKEVPGIKKILRVVHSPNVDDYKLHILIRIKEGYPLWETAYDFQKEVNDKIEYMTAFNVTKVDCEVRGIG